jgi:hypothetical protein
MDGNGSKGWTDSKLKLTKIQLLDLVHQATRDGEIPPLYSYARDLADDWDMVRTAADTLAAEGAATRRSAGRSALPDTGREDPDAAARRATIGPEETSGRMPRRDPRLVLQPHGQLGTSTSSPPTSGRTSRATPSQTRRSSAPPAICRRRSLAISWFASSKNVRNRAGSPKPVDPPHGLWKLARPI